jgi:prevent-host-death family protein
METVMDEVGTFDAKNRFSELLSRAEAGEEISITRHGKIVAKLVPAENDNDRLESARAAAARIREMRKGVTLGGLKIKDLIKEGQR